MPSDSSPDYLTGVISQLRALPAETGWVEFKTNYANPDDVGTYVSALANTAAIEGQPYGYVVWGVRDATHEVVGTTFRPARAKKGNEDLIPWLARLLTPRIHVEFFELTYEGRPVVLLRIPRALGRPVQFAGAESVRVGSCRQPLKDHPELERALWRTFDVVPFETLPVAERVTDEEVVTLLDTDGYLRLLHLPLPSDRGRLLARLAQDGLVTPCAAGGWDVLALGAILFARDLNQFAALRRKAVRVVVYDGTSRLKTRREQVGSKGYASGFEGLVGFIGALLPRTEVIGQALREDAPAYPDLAVRELVANALIHQDLAATGEGPMIEIFDDRVEVTNPGRPLMDASRLLDTTPKSRNEALAALMRRTGICEERGSGIDKVVALTEQHQLPAPRFDTPGAATRTVLFAHRALRDMDRDDRVRACYLHACLLHVRHEQLTNASLRQRFGIAEQNSAVASRIIADAVHDGRIKPYDPAQGKKYARYVPGWA